MWQMITEHLTDEDGISYTAYGFRNGECTVNDFTSIPEEAESFIAMLNELEVSPLHILDVIEDHFAAV